MLSFFLGWLGLSHAADLSQSEADRIGQLIFKNECNLKLQCLTAWNQGEEFASLGIGHFIWYPSAVGDKDKVFDESFPKLLKYIDKQGAVMPAWLHSPYLNPWLHRADFEASQKSEKMQSLRSFLQATRALQVQFIQQRMRHALTTILEHVEPEKHAHIRMQFKRVEASLMGVYVLMDYVNFKGEGVKPTESYQGQGWGLLQVLEHMQGKQVGLVAIEAFSHSARQRLQRRVELSPPERGEQRWLKGWNKRLDGYVKVARDAL
ncbi:MAG: hypothetical protein R8K49_04005 [Mariprofundaceae bacterium]